APPALEWMGHPVSASAHGSLFMEPALTPASELVSRHFAPGEFERLNPGAYHDTEHPRLVADLVGDMALAAGRRPERAEFLKQVALLHDADERKADTPARAKATLVWMDARRDELSARFGWSRLEFLEAKALIARTDFPFDEGIRKIGTPYDAKSPVQIYAELLRELPPERREAVMHEGLMLRFADQTGNYTISFERAYSFTEGLALELRSVGAPVTHEGLLQTTPGFLAAAGQDTDFDRRVAGEVGVDAARLPGRDTLMGWMPEGRRAQFQSNQRQFAERSTAVLNPSV
ncbi:MAG: hypothetical protein AB1758_16725, partial [Candidatus Eremiobacterota bacterium]